MERSLPLVVFSHLRWDFVYQRPQHLLSRLAAGRQVLVIEEPVQVSDASPRWELQRPQAGLTVARLHTPVETPGFHRDHQAIMGPLLVDLLAAEGIGPHAAWLYTPLAVPFARPLAPRAVFYDCMDDLASFLHAPPALRELEAELMAWADVVFTGGPSLYEARRGQHPNLHCFPSSVDAAHFSSASSIPEAADQAALSHPRLGFFGVLDERLDLELIGALAAAHPEWQIVMVGPVVKIDPASLPRAANLHYFGQRRYEELPAYLAGWDVCLLPFARNEATRFISPTKTLEYMAAERPIVSTPLVDVAKPYGEIVYLGDTPAAFIAACERALSASPSERATRSAAMRAVLARTSWDRTAAAMEQLIEQALAASGRRLAA